MNLKEKLGYYFLGVATTAALSVGYVDYRTRQMEKKYYDTVKQQTEAVQKSISDAAQKIAGDLEKKLEVEVDQIRDHYGVPIPKRDK